MTIDGGAQKNNIFQKAHPRKKRFVLTTNKPTIYTVSG